MPPARLEKSSAKAHRAAFSHISCIKPKQLIVATARIFSTLPRLGAMAGQMCNILDPTDRVRMSGTLTSDVNNTASAYSGQETTYQLSNCDAALRHVDRQRTMLRTQLWIMDDQRRYPLDRLRWLHAASGENELTMHVCRPVMSLTSLGNWWRNKFWPCALPVPDRAASYPLPNWRE